MGVRSGGRTVVPLPWRGRSGMGLWGNFKFSVRSVFDLKDFGECFIIRACGSASLRGAGGSVALLISLACRCHAVG